MIKTMINNLVLSLLRYLIIEVSVVSGYCEAQPRTMWPSKFGFALGLL